MLEQIVGVLPAGLQVLRAAAAAEGYRMLDRLEHEWETGQHRFDRPGERLMCARLGDRLVAIGGITIDQHHPAALRLRRFYIAPANRRQGIGRALAIALIRRPECQGRRIIVNAGSELAAQFWEALGFVRAETHWSEHTHVLPVAAVTLSCR